MNRFRNPPALFFENARLVDPVMGEIHGTLRLARGRIDGINVPPQRADLRMDLAGAFVIPGLINAHDHLELNNFPRWKHRPIYENARAWAADANARLDSDAAIVAARAVPLADRLFLGGLKNLLSGVTTVAHHNPYHAPLREAGYPVRVVSRYGWSHSLYLAPDFAKTYRRTPRDVPYMIHLAEGTDAEAQCELDRLDAAGALHANTVLVHGVGLTLTQRLHAIAQAASLAWCPSSNLFLLNASAHVQEFSKAHRLAIGSDSRLTGERDLLDELRIARESEQITPDALFRAVTSDAANVLRLTDVGALKQGMRGDVVILPNTLSSAAEALGQIQRAGARAVIRGGELQIADPDLASPMDKPIQIRLDGRPKMLSRGLALRYARTLVSEPGLELV